MGQVLQLEQSNMSESYINSLGNNLNIINFLVWKQIQFMYFNSNAQPYSRYTVEAYFLFMQKFEYEPSQAFYPL